ncbi:MAG TPA: hypothetical protein VFA32_10005 [Dehalococcoidia bacterium]|nr:hypothetical protein [Dehalococcoidia bacterium]
MSEVIPCANFKTIRTVVTSGHCHHPAPFDGKPVSVQPKPMRYRYAEYCCICGQQRKRVYVRQQLQGHGPYLHPSQKVVFREVDPWEDPCPGPGEPWRRCTSCLGWWNTENGHLARKHAMICPECDH